MPYPGRKLTPSCSAATAHTRSSARSRGGRRASPLRGRYGALPPPSRPAAREMNMIGMPIMSRGELIGVFGIGAWPPKQLGDAEQALLEHFARPAAVAIR